MLPSSWKGEIERAVQDAAGSTDEKWKSAADQQNTSNAAIADKIDSFAHHFCAYKEQQNTDYRKERTLNKITIILVFLTVLFTGGSWWVFKGQLDEMRKASEQTEKIIGTNTGLAEAAKQQATAAIDAAKASREAMIAAQRAWVGPNNAKIETPPVAGKSLEVILEYQNTGREPALGLTWDADTFIATVEEDSNGTASKKTMDYIARCKIQWKPQEARVAYPTSGFNQYNLNKTVDGELIDEAVVSGEKFIIFHGCFMYKTFETIHRSSFCYFFKSGKTKPANLNICAVGNDAD